METNLNLKGTKSEANLRAALSGESIARNKYTYYAQQARKEGLEDVANLYERMAKNESEHAKIWYKYLNGEMKSTMNNLYESASGEGYEYSNMYPKFAQIAREEGFEELAKRFENIAEIEHNHELTFMKAMANITQKNTTFEPEQKEAEKKYEYRCVFCGKVSDKPLDVCPVCEAIGAFQHI